MNNWMLIALLALLAIAACRREPTYLDLNTGDMVKLEKDSSGIMVNAETHQPVKLYVNTATHDTIYGPTGDVVNNKLARRDGRYYYTEDEDWKAMNAPRPAPAAIPSGVEKIKVEKDGDVKIKTKHGKVKIDGETGERKVKRE